jgi:hypothetical protein
MTWFAAVMFNPAPAAIGDKTQIPNPFEFEMFTAHCSLFFSFVFTLCFDTSAKASAMCWCLCVCVFVQNNLIVVFVFNYNSNLFIQK